MDKIKIKRSKHSQVNKFARFIKGEPSYFEYVDVIHRCELVY